MGKMKKNILLIYLLSAFFACKTASTIYSGEDSLNKVMLHEGVWVSNFKNQVFIQCLYRLFPADFNAKLNSLDGSSAANLDHLGYNEKIRDAIDSLAISFSKRNETKWTIENRNVTINVCLSYRNSIELDSIALRFYNQYSAK
jgi:hypothetical protein